MKILVTGAGGRIGRLLTDELLKLGHFVRGADMVAINRTDKGFESLSGNLTDESDTEKMVEGMNAIFHLGAFMSWNPKDKKRLFGSNVEGTRLLLDAAVSAGVERFIFASSGEVYPENAPEFQPITEDHPLRPNSNYGLTKLLGEELVEFHQRAGNLQTTILRFGHTQDAVELLDEESFFSGPRFFLRPRIAQQESFGNTELAEKLRERDPGRPAHILSRNENSRPFQMHITDTRDMVSGLILALEHSESIGGIFNLGSTEPVDFGVLLEEMSRITGYPVVEFDFEGQGVHYHTSNAMIREKLGFKPRFAIDLMLKEAGEAWRKRK